MILYSVFPLADQWDGHGEPVPQRRRQADREVPGQAAAGGAARQAAGADPRPPDGGQRLGARR